MHPLLVYARLEIVLLSRVAGAVRSAVGGRSLYGGWRRRLQRVLLRGLFCAIFLLAPCMAMGATLPAAAAWLSATPQG
jgi:hypothetical protein